MVCPIPRSGHLGFVGDYTGAVLTRYSRVRNWTFDETSMPQERVYSGTRFGVQRIPCYKQSSGSFSGFGVSPPLFAGDVFTFFGYTAPTNGVACTPGCAYHVLSIVDSVTLNWNWTAEGCSLDWSIAFSGIAAPTVLAAFDDPCDDAPFCDMSPCTATLLLYNPCAAMAAVEFCNITTAALTFTAKNIAFSNSSSSCFVQKTVGNLDWTLAVVDQNPCIIPTLNLDYRIKLQATAAPAYWILDYGIFTGVNNLNVNIETGEMVSKTNNWMMQGVLCCTVDTPVRGSIISPAGVTVWPFSTPS